MWVASALGGALVGYLCTLVIEVGKTGSGAPDVPLVLVIPFAVLLGSIALMPFINAKVWHDHFPDFAFFLGSMVAVFYAVELGGEGRGAMVHALVEYYSFIALVGGLYVVSGGILIDIRGQGRPITNTMILAFGAVAANVVGTTGASVLLIRPFMRFNRGRLRALHVVMFIFIVSNCGGCLTPIGDPPLYLGYLKGVPFAWTMKNLWGDWLLVNGLLLAVFFVMDTIYTRSHDHRGVEHTPAPEAALHREHGGRRVTVQGVVGLVCLVLMIAGVFIDPMLKAYAKIEHIPVGATFQIGVAVAAYFMSKREYYTANDFSFFPVKEVGLLFAGIFATMVPALGYLALHGASMGIDTPTTFYYATGGLSAMLDNAPTYLNFLQLAIGAEEINAGSIAKLVSTHEGVLDLIAVSSGAVFFGAMTYIGNGPNFMVRAIAESAGVRMPSFFGYLLRACVILLPVLVVHWLVFIR
jgi:Na+/H+ antiporter NhaD/arsenite permease-like protein